ncbi:MAG: VOC family protein [Chloroflexi bacterium]|nr:VOC family protein [Chloroflexota bacterium]
MTATVAGYSHVAICVSDVDKARDFYSGTLGLPEAERPDFGFPGAWYQIGPLQLHLMQRDVPEGGTGIGPHFALWIPTDEFQDYVEQVRDGGGSIMVEPNLLERVGVCAEFCIEAEGIIIELNVICAKG